MPAIHYECRPEECLLTNLGFGKYLDRHHNGSGGICELLSREKNLFGWIDEDPTANHHPYYRSMYANSKSDKFGLRYCYDPQKNNKLIIVKPKLEDWLITISQKAGVNLNDFELSEDPDELHKIINFKISKFQEVLHTLIKLKSPALIHAIQILKSK
jgi:hypothetical protein